MSETPMVIAVDGPAASGKGTLARRLADHLGFAYLDTGLLYRAVGARLLDDNEDMASEDAAVRAAEAIQAADLKRGELRTDTVAVAASRVAAMPGVRRALLDFQRRFAQAPPDGASGAVLDGRDIGSVVCPNATVKLFVTAAEDVRAQRRLRELQGRGVEAIHEGVLRDLRERDSRDASRAVAPLRPAEDAIIIDTSLLDPDGVFDAALSAIRSRYQAAEQPRTRSKRS